MKFLYVPWRSKYIKENQNSQNDNNCPFCIKLEQNDDSKNYILGRYKYNFIILNLHPYNAGHLMILPFKHLRNISDMSCQEQTEFIELISLSTKILQEKMKAQGINIGMNIGQASGAGIPSHIHMHVIPRWEGDTNFLPIIANTKTISMDLNQIYNELKPYFENLKK